MALAIDYEGYGEETDCDATTGWAAATISGPVAEDNIYMEGGGAVSFKASNKSGEGYYDFGSGTELDFDTGGTEEGQLIFINLMCTTLGALETLANDGLTIRVMTDLSNYRDYLIAGSDDFHNFRQGRNGFVWFVLDPTLTPSSETGVAFDIGSIRYIGCHIETTGLVKAENLIIDGLAIGSGLRITGTSTQGWQDLADYCTAYATRAWGPVDYDDAESTIFVRGHLHIGDSTQTSATSFVDSGKKIKFIHTEYYVSSAWAPMVSDNYMGITVEDAVSYATTFQDGTVVGTDKGRSGSLIEGDDALDTTVVLYGGNSTSSLTTLYGTTFKGVTGSITWGDDSDHQCYSVTFEGCAQFVPVGAVKIRNCIFIATTDDDGTKGAAVLWNSNIDIQDSQFIANDGTTYTAGIEHSTGGTVEYYGLTFSGNDYAVLHTSAGDLLVQNKKSAAGILSDASTAYNSGGGTATFETLVAMSVHVEDSGGTDLPKAQVYIQKASPTAFTADAGNSAGDGALIVNEVVDTDIPQTGRLAVWVKTLNASQPYRHASWTGKTFTFPTEESGACSTDGTATQLIDSSADFGGATDVEEGDTIRNTSDGSWAVVDRIISSIELLTSALRSGTNDEWRNGNNWSVHKLATNLTDNDDTVDVPLMNQQTDSSGDAVKDVKYTALLAIEAEIRKASQAGSKFQNFETSGTLSANGYTLTAILQDDEVA